jgi:uncharacterized protein
VEQEVIRFARSVALVLLLITRTAVLAAQPLPPELTQPVNDFAHVIDQVSRSEIEQRIIALKNATGDVVVVATIDTFAPYADINEYAVKMFENHGRGIGAKGKDNGLLVVLAVKDRRVRAEVGYDLEQFVTDGYAGEVSRTVMAPYFARGEYGRGLLEGTTRFIARIAQGRGVTLSGVPAVPMEPRASGGWPFSPGLIIFIIIVFIMLSNMGNRSRFGGGRRRWGGGPWSGWNSGVGPFGGGGGFGGGGFGGGFGGFGGGRSGGGGGGAGW